MKRSLFLAVLLCCAPLQPARVQERQREKPQPAPAVTTQQATPARTNDLSRAVESSLTAEQFAALSAKLSEPNGYFDTDNLISNESSYLHVLGKMRQMRLSGGAYIGVGPDQSFSYIAQVRPRIAFIVDIRRDNLLQHLLFKSLFAASRNRLEYLCLLFGKAVPADVKAWDGRTVQDIVAYLDKTPAKAELFDKTHAALQARIKSYGIKLDATEIETINRIHKAFFTEGLDLKFTSRNRPPRYYYPSYRDLMLEKDLTGKQANYLTSEDDFRFLQNLEERNLVIPVVGNLAGTHTLKAIAQYLSERNERVSAFYTSNVEFYLMRGYRDDDEFDRFAKNVQALPRDANSVIIRSYFNGTWGYAHPHTVSGYYSTQLLQTMESFVKEHASGGYQSYSDLIGKHLLDLK
jgi:hypothetical protein